MASAAWIEAITPAAALRTPTVSQVSSTPCCAGVRTRQARHAVTPGKMVIVTP